MTKDKSRNILGTEKIEKLLIKFAVPSVIAMLVSALYNIVDQFFIGRSIGSLGNAATNVTFPLTTLCIAVSLLLGIGGSAAFNLAMGRGDKKNAVYYIGNSVFLLFTIGIILCIFSQLFLTPMLKFFGSPDNVLDYARTYTRITSIGFPFLILSTGGGHIIRADGSPKYSMICNLTGAFINIILDPVFIFGLNMGMMGAALATIIGQTASGILVIRYLMHYKTVSIERKHLVPQIKYAKRIISLGAAPGFNQIAMMIVQIVMNKSLTYYGSLSSYGESIPLACVGIIAKVNAVYFAIIIGISQSIQPIASFNYGSKQYERVKKVYLLAITCGTIISSIAFAMFMIFPRSITALFGSGDEMYFKFAVSYFRIFLFMTFLNAMQPITSNFFTAIGKAKKGVFLSLTRQILFLLPLIVVLPLIVGIDGIMYAGPAADLVAAVVSLIMVFLELKRMY